MTVRSTIAGASKAAGSSYPSRRAALLRTLREGAPLAGRVDWDEGIIFGVKVNGRTSPNTHGVEGARSSEYTMEALREELPQIEGIEVNVDHPDRHQPDRDVSARDRYAWITEAHLTEDGIFGNLHFYNPKGELAVSMMTSAEKRQGKGFALSHNARGSGDVVNGVYRITTVPEVRSVDIVADGGSNRSLFEGRRGRKMKTITLREYLALPLAKGRNKRLRKLCEMYEAAGDMPMEAPPEEPAEAGGGAEPMGETDELDHLFQAFKKCLTDDPEKAKKILKLLEPEKGGGGEEPLEENEEEEEETEPGKKGKDMEEGEEPSMGRKTNESRHRLVQEECELAGVEATRDLVESLAPLNGKGRRAVLRTIKGQGRGGAGNGAARSASPWSPLRESRDNGRAVPKTAEEQATALLRG